MARVRGVWSATSLDDLRATVAPLRPGPRGAEDDADAVHRRRLLTAVIGAVGEHGYASTTIADIVRRARVSRRTFYDHFDDKEECFLTAYRAGVGLLLRAATDAAAQQQEWLARLNAGVEAFLAGLAFDPVITRMFTTEILGTGPNGLRERRRVHNYWVDTLVTLIREARENDPALRQLTHDLSRDNASAIVGGIFELIMIAVEEDRIDQLPTLRGTILDLFQAMLYRDAPRLRPLGYS